MASLAFLWLAGIRGESQDPRHLGDIDVRSYAFNVDVGQSISQSHATVSIKAQRAEISIVKNIDNTSPLLFQACALGQHIPTAIISVERNVGGKSAGEILKVVMRDVMITSIKPGGSVRDDSSPLEAATLSYGSMSYQSKADQ